MNFSKKDIIIFTLISVLFYLCLNKRENFTNAKTDIKNIIEQQYEIDVESIKNLSNLANQLTKNGKLVVPGGLEIKGNLKVGGTVGIRNDPHPKVGLIIDGTGLSKGIETEGAVIYADKGLTVNGPTNLNGGTNVKAETNFHKPVAFKNQKSSGWSYINHANGHCSISVPFHAWKTSQLRGDVIMEGNTRLNKLHVDGTSRLNGNVGIRTAAHPKVGLIVNGAGLAQGVETSGAGIYADKSLRVQGNTRLNGNVGVRREAHPKVGLIVNGAGLTQGVETEGAGIYCDKILTVNGSTNLNGVTKVKAKTYFYKQVAFKNQKKEGKWTYINHDNGHCSINSPFYVWHDSHLRGDVKMESNLKVNGHVGVRRDPHSKIGLIVNGRGLSHGVETEGAGIYCDKNLIVTGKINGK